MMKLFTLKLTGRPWFILFIFCGLAEYSAMLQEKKEKEEEEERKLETSEEKEMDVITEPLVIVQEKPIQSGK